MFKFTMNMSCDASRACRDEAMSACSASFAHSIIAIVIGISVLMSIFAVALIDAALLLGLACLIGLLLLVLTGETQYTPEKVKPKLT